MAEHDQDSEQYDTAVDEYLTRSYDGERCRTLLKSSSWDPAFCAELADLGWFALAVPESHGGLGASLSDIGTVFMQFGRHLVAGPLLENILLPALLHSADQAAAALAAAIEAGTPLALVDPGISGDWAADVGTVSLDADQLTGSVNAVRFAQQASVLVVIATPEPATESGVGPVICLVDPAASGLSIEDLHSTDPATEFSRVVLDGVRPVECLNASANDDLVSRLRSWARLLIACELSGLAQGSLEQTIEYLGQREQFGQKIGGFQAVKHIAADMHTRSAGLRNLCLAALTDARSASTEELEIVAQTAKAHAARTAMLVCEDAIQLHGGMGFTTESDVSWHYKRTLALRAWYGDDTELHRRIGQSVLDRLPAPAAAHITEPETST